MVKHIVTFKLTGTPEERLEVATKFKEALLALPSQIDVLESMEVGINQNPAEQWDVVLTAVVPTMADVMYTPGIRRTSPRHRFLPAIRTSVHALTTNSDIPILSDNFYRCISEIHRYFYTLIKLQIHILTSKNSIIHHIFIIFATDLTDILTLSKILLWPQRLNLEVRLD